MILKTVKHLQENHLKKELNKIVYAKEPIVEIGKFSQHEINRIERKVRLDCFVSSIIFLLPKLCIKMKCLKIGTFL